MLLNLHNIVKRPLPVWLAAVVPATLAGHGLAYAFAGRSAGDGHHAWMAPALECSLAILAAVVLMAIGSSLLKAGILMHTPAEQSYAALWPRLAFSQIVVFDVVENAEGAHVSIPGIVVQIAVALLVAYLLCRFACLLVRCAQNADEASRYLQRLLNAITSYVFRQPAPFARALAVHAGVSRFQRPPPHA